MPIAKNVDFERRHKGRFFTIKNPFDHKAFLGWADLAGLARDNLAVLEPFAGAGDIIRHLKGMFPGLPYRMYDIEPRGDEVVERDTFKSFPTGHKVCITNPPWLGKSHAQRAEMRVGATLDDDYDNLYAKALGLALTHCEWVAALVPGSFLVSKIFRERLCDYIEVTCNPFVEIDPPVGLALFTPYRPAAWVVYSGDERIGFLDDIERHYPAPPHRCAVFCFNRAFFLG